MTEALVKNPQTLGGWKRTAWYCMKYLGKKPPEGWIPDHQTELEMHYRNVLLELAEELTTGNCDCVCCEIAKGVAKQARISVGEVEE